MIESDPFEEALAAQRLQTRISAIVERAPKPLPVVREDGTTLLRGRRRTDRCSDAPDRRSMERRRP